MYSITHIYCRILYPIVFLMSVQDHKTFCVGSTRADIRGIDCYDAFTIPPVINLPRLRLG